MQIRRDARQLGGLAPEAVVTLSSIPSSVPLYNTTRLEKSRHPLGVYNISWQYILYNFEFIISAINELVTSFGKPTLDFRHFDRLGFFQTNLLRSIDEHFDDCEVILRAFFPKGSRFNGNEYVESYRGAIKVYKDHVRKIVNHLKHSQGRIRIALLVFRNPPSFPDLSFVMPTYYVEGVNAQGIPGPLSDVHDGQIQAFSHFHDLKYHLCNLYILSHYLADAVTQIVGESNIVPPMQVNARDIEFSKLAEVISLVQDIFLPNDKQIGIPHVKFEHDSEGYAQLSMTLPRTEPLPIYKLGVGEVVTVWPGDGITQSQVLPFPLASPYPPNETQAGDENQKGSDLNPQMNDCQ